MTGTSTSSEAGGVHDGSRESAVVIRDRLRAEILRGHRVPGSEMPQARIAEEFGVSRGPVREAFRLLQSEGLIDARVNHRARVAGLSVGDLEHAYTLRVLHESLAVSVSVPLFNRDELEELDELAELLAGTDAHTVGFDTWDETHQRFHMLLLAHSGPRMLDSAAEWAAHTQRYRRAYVETCGGPPQGASEHRILAQLCRDREPEPAAQLLAAHLARAALTLMVDMAPAHDPTLLRAALRQVGSGSTMHQQHQADRRAGG